MCVACNERNENVVGDCSVQTFLDFLFGECFAVKEFHHKFFVGFGNEFHKFAVEIFDFALQILRSCDFFALQIECLAGENVYATDHLAAFHNRKLDGDDAFILCHNRSCSAHKVTVVFVNRVDENESRDFLFLAKFESFLRADGDRAGCTCDDNRAVCRMKSRDHFAFEVEETGSVENIDFGVAINCIAKRQRNGYFAFDFFIVIVHSG